MKRIIKRFAIIFAGFFALVLATAALLASLFEDQIGQKLIAEVNKQIKSELKVEKFDLTVVRSFPNVAANLRGIVLADSRDGTLLQAGNLSFRFGLLSLLSSDIKVKSVVLSDGVVNVEIDKRGRPNYDIFMESPEEKEEDEGPAISLETARLQNTELSYKDESVGQNLAVLVEDATFSGQFSSAEFSMRSKADLFSHALEMEKSRYLTNKRLSYDARIFVDFEERTYRIEELKLDVEGNVFKADGSVELRDDATYFDLIFSSDKGSLASVLSLLPEEYMKNFSDFSSSGNFEFNAAIKGLSSKKENPEIRVDLTMENGKITSSRMGEPLKNVSFAAIFDNGKYRNNRSTVFAIENLEGYFNRERFDMRLKVENLDDPDIEFLLDGALPMNAIFGLFNNPKITDGSGEIEVKNLTLKGRRKDMISVSRIAKVEAAGEVEFDDASLKINGENLILDRGFMKLDGNKLSIEGLKVEGPGTDLIFNGVAYNILPVLFADSANTNRAELEFQADLQSEKLDIDRLMNMAALSQEAEAAPEPVQDSLKVDQIRKREQTTSLLKGAFSAVIREFNYNKIEGRDFSGKLEFKNNEMAINGKTQAMGGDFALNGSVFFEDKPRLKAKLFCDKIDVKEFFRQADNFGQEVLVDKNVSGTLNARILIYAYWDEEGNYLGDELRVLAGVGIENGELVNFKMLESFSTFVNIKDLRHIRFTNLQNFLEVSNRRFYLPVMFIQSNALNLTVSGEHSFDNDIKYHLKVNAGQVLAERFRRHDSNLTPVKASKKGFFNLHYAVSGTIENYTFKSAKRQVKSDFDRSDLRKRQIQSELEREFGAVDLVNEPEEWRDIPEYDEGQPGEDEYLWEGDPDFGIRVTPSAQNETGQSLTSSSSPFFNERENARKENHLSAADTGRSSIFSKSRFFRPKREPAVKKDSSEYIDWDDE